MPTISDLYSVAQRADDAWSKALQLAFGKQAGDARYDARGVSTPELKALNHAKKVADLAWHNSIHGDRQFKR